MKKIFTSVILIFCTSTFLFSQVGQLDPSFANNGVFAWDINGGHDVPQAMDFQDDGKMVFVLSEDFPGVSNFDIAIVRLNVDGSVDSTFAVNGLYHYSNPVASDLAYHLQILEDGKILACGSHGISAGNPDWLLIKLNADGTPDVTFGTNGIVIHEIASSQDYAHSFTIRDNGKIVVGGKSHFPDAQNNYRNVVCQFTADGQLDSLFGDHGCFIWNNFEAYHEVLDVDIADDGGILACGKSAPAGTDRLGLYKILEDGSSLDSTFADNGEILAPYQGSAEDMLIQSNGTILITGSNSHIGGTDIVILAYHQDGTPNTSFAEDGVFLLDVNINDRGRALVEQPDGKVMVAGITGGAFGFPPPGGVLSARMDAMGNLDPSWGGDGHVTWMINSGIGAGPQDIDIQADGKVVLTGSWAELGGNDMLVLRYGNFIDVDMDGYGLEDDCNDADATINPGVQEEPYNGIDDDCDPLTLDDDLDQDGFDLVDDCDDTNPNVNTSTVEIPYNGLDDDCDPLTLDDDLDQDGFLLADDCDDTNSEINPDATEILNNGIDEDCDGEDLMVGVNETVLAQRFVIYPNPAKNTIFIEFNDQTLSIDYLEILDYTGKIVKQFDYITNSHKMAVNIENLPSGLWILAIHTNEGIATKRVIKIN